MGKSINVVSASESRREQRMKQVGLEMGRAAVHIEAKRTDDRTDLVAHQKDFRHTALAVRAHLRNYPELLEEYPFLKDFRGAFGEEINIVKAFAKKVKDQDLKDDLLDLLYIDTAMEYHARAVDLQDPLPWKQCWPDYFPDVEDGIDIDPEAEKAEFGDKI